MRIRCRGPDIVCIYSDASEIGEHVGAAVILRGGNGTQKTASMGKRSISTIYAAELKG